MDQVLSCEVGRELTEADLAEHGRRLADLIARIEAEKSEASEQAKQNRERINGLQEQAEKLAGVIRAGSLTESLPCRITHDFAANAVRYLRTDTGECVKERAMTAEEREHLAQRPLAPITMTDVPPPPEAAA